jgi:hypothetical protein
MPRNHRVPASARFRVTAPIASLAAALFLCAPSAPAQNVPELPQPSPLVRLEQRVGVTDFAVEYSSPGVKKRKIWGGLVPYDELWRTGANAATKLEASRDFTFAGTAVPAGTYALYTIPGKKSWTVILNTNWKTGGTNGYEEKNDVARVSVKPASAPHRERMAILFSETTDDSTRLDLEWEKVRVSVPIGVDTTTQVLGNIDKAIDEAWRPHFTSARWLLDNGGDLDRALGYVDTSISIKPTWWNHWVKGQILAKQGKAVEAVAMGEKAEELGKGDRVFEGFFKEQVLKTIAEWRKNS